MGHKPFCNSTNVKCVDGSKSVKRGGQKKNRILGDETVKR